MVPLWPEHLAQIDVVDEWLSGRERFEHIVEAVDQVCHCLDHRDPIGRPVVSLAFELGCHPGAGEVDHREHVGEGEP